MSILTLFDFISLRLQWEQVMSTSLGVLVNLHIVSHCVMISSGMKLSGNIVSYCMKSYIISDHIVCHCIALYCIIWNCII